MRVRRPEACAMSLLLALSACHDPVERSVCVPVGPAVRVTVYDSITNAAAATGARGVAERPGDVDSLIVLAPEEMVSHHFATQATYSVRIEKAGYQPWSATLVAPPAGRCGPIGVQAVARLQAAAQP